MRAERTGVEPHRERQSAAVPSRAMAPNRTTAVADRFTERRRAVALARHYRESEGLSIRQIAERLGRAPATVKAYFYDPTGEKARAVKARYVGVCRGCGAYTQPRNGKGDAYAYCKACHPGAIERRWTRVRVLEAMRDWRVRYGRLPSSYDWSADARTSARGKRAQATARRRLAFSERRHERAGQLGRGQGAGRVGRKSEPPWPGGDVIVVGCSRPADGRAACDSRRALERTGRRVAPASGVGV